MGNFANAVQRLNNSNSQLLADYPALQGPAGKIGKALAVTDHLHEVYSTFKPSGSADKVKKDKKKGMAALKEAGVANRAAYQSFKTVANTIARTRDYNIEMNNIVGEAQRALENVYMRIEGTWK